MVMINILLKNNCTVKGLTEQYVLHNYIASVNNKMELVVSWPKW